MKVLVTGAAGFIGSKLSEVLLARGDEVVGFDNFDPYYDPAVKRATIEQIVASRAGERFRLVEGDLRDRALIDSLVASEDIDAIAHLAGLAGVRASIGQALLYDTVNVQGTIHLLDAALAHGVDRFVYASTSSVYGNTDQVPFIETNPCDRPLAPYPASKRSAELLGHAYHNLHGLNFTALRFFTVYGPRNRPDMMAHLLLDSITEGHEVKLFNGGQMWRDWTYVGDVAHGVAVALDRPLGYEIINMGRGQPVLLKDFVSTLENLAGSKATLSRAPMPQADVTRTFASIEKAATLLGYAPQTSVAEGAEHLWRWYQATRGH